MTNAQESAVGAGATETIKLSTSQCVIGMDVGSTTVKAVVIDRTRKKILWNDYQRHHTKQPEKVLELLRGASTDVPSRTLRRAAAACS